MDLDINVKINTNNEKDIEILKKLVEAFVSKDIKTETKTTSVKVIPKYPGKGKEGVLMAVSEGEGLTLRQIVQATGLAEDTVKNYLWQLNKANKIEKSTSIPRIYYKKGENADLKRMVPTGTKVSVLR